MKKQGNSKSRPDVDKSCQDTSEAAWGDLQVASTWPPELPRRLQDGPGSLQDASHTPPGPPQDLPRRLQDRPQRAQGAPKSLQDPLRRLREAARALQERSRRGFGDPKPHPRALQKRLWRLQAASKSSPQEPSKPPAVALHPLASGLQVAWRDARSGNNSSGSKRILWHREEFQKILKNS